MDREKYTLWASMPQYKRKKETTIENVRAMLDIVESPYIAFSCGKDSSVMADMILSINPKIKCRFISSGETRIIHNVDDVIGYFVKKYNADIEEIMFDRIWSEEWKDATFDEQRKAGRRDIQAIDNSGFDGVFMGLRREESRGRTITLKLHQTKGLPRGMYKYTNRNFYRMCPLGLWTTDDIGAYISENDIPVLNWYEQFGFSARTTARLTGDSIRQNSISWLKFHNPAGYLKLVQRFPELGIYK